MVILLVIAIMSTLIFLGYSLLAHYCSAQYDDKEQKEHSKGHVRWHVGNKDINAHHIPFEGISNLKGSGELSPIDKKYPVAVMSLEGEIPIAITKYSKDQWYILETKQEITSHPLWGFAKNTEISYGERLVVTAEYSSEDICSKQVRIYNNFIEYELKDGRRVFDLPMGDNITFKGKSLYQDDELYSELQGPKKEIKLFNPITNEELLVCNTH